jgi:hypothetical protein
MVFAARPIGVLTATIQILSAENADAKVLSLACHFSGVYSFPKEEFQESCDHGT